MLETANEILMQVLDAIFGWLLLLPKDLALVAVAFLSAAVLVGVRKFTTNQDLLRRCRNDKRRLKELIREAKRRKDKDAVRRHQAVKGTVAIRQLGAEGLPLVVALIPIALLATWCFQRLAFHPPKPGEPVVVAATFPVSAEGDFAHLVPVDGLKAGDGWIREIEIVEGGEQPHGQAVWTLEGSGRVQPYDLQMRWNGATFERSFRIGGKKYAPPVCFYSNGPVTISVEMKPVKLFGVVPGFGVFFPPWLVGYLVLVIPMVPALKRLLRIY